MCFKPTIMCENSKGLSLYFEFLPVKLITMFGRDASHFLGVSLFRAREVERTQPDEIAAGIPALADKEPLQWMGCENCPDWSWVLGLSACFCGAFLGDQLAANVFRLSRRRESARHDQRPSTQQPLWWAGVACSVLGVGATYVALSFIQLALNVSRGQCIKIEIPDVAGWLGGGCPKMHLRLCPALLPRTDRNATVGHISKRGRCDPVQLKHQGTRICTSPTTAAWLWRCLGGRASALCQ